MIFSAFTSFALLCLTSYHGVNAIATPSHETTARSLKAIASKSKNGKFFKSAWYPGWKSDTFPVSKVPWSKYTHMTFAFGVTTNDSSYFNLDLSHGSVLPEFVSAAHSAGVKASLSIGGWTGSRYFSDHFATPTSRSGFIKAITKAVKKYKLDGIDFDWEYPNGLGIGCNTIRPDDTANYATFLHELREHPVGKKLLLTAAVYIKPFSDANGNPSTDMSAFGKYLDYLMIMDYDIWGAWASPAIVGPNAPLDDACASKEHQMGSATAAIENWTSAKFPKEKIVLGLAAYGHSFAVKKSDAYISGTTLASYPPFNASVYPVGDATDVGPYTPDVCGNPTNPSGVYTFQGLVDDGWLKTDGSVAPGYHYRFDTCSQTAYIYNPVKEQMVSYEDVPAWRAKGSFIKSNGLAGFASWEATDDYNHMLLDAISCALDD